MDIETIISVLKDPKPDYDSLLQALTIIRHHINYCLTNNIDMWKDPLLARALIWR